MKKEILERGYITHCLTDGENNFLNQKGHTIHSFDKYKPLYWSEVYCEPDNMTVLTRKGTLLDNNTSNEELQKLHQQSIINCSK